MQAGHFRRDLRAGVMFWLSFSPYEVHVVLAVGMVSLALGILLGLWYGIGR